MFWYTFPTDHVYIDTSSLLSDILTMFDWCFSHLRRRIAILEALVAENFQILSKLFAKHYVQSLAAFIFQRQMLVLLFGFILNQIGVVMYFSFPWLNLLFMQ